jgi:hypothetical protein
MSRKGCCGFCGNRLPHPRYEVTLTGDVVALIPPHRCVNHNRRLAGICQDCPSPVAGKVGRALRCKLHTQLRRQAMNRRSDQLHRVDRNERSRLQLRRNPKRRLRKQETNRAWKLRNPDKVKRHKRRDAIKNAERYRTYMHAYNAARRETKLEYMKRYRVYGPDNPPRCKDCGEIIEWSGIGRPKTTCSACKGETQELFTQG